MKTKSKRIFYFDALRALAILCVIIIHVYALTCHYVIGGYETLSFEWVFTQIIGNPFRIGVDLFLMLSGALSLGREWNIKSFLGKRLPRIAMPFIFWNIVLITIYITLSHIGIIHYVQSFDLASIIDYIHKAFVGRTTGFGPNWFFWMILGTYLIMPIFNKWLQHSDLKEAEYFLIFWLITAIFDFTLMSTFPIKLSYFTSPIGFVVLGYYLRHTERPILNNKMFILGLILIPAAILIIKSIMLSTPTHMAYPHRYSIWLSLEVAGIFLLFKNTKFNINKNGIIYKTIFVMARYSYGIYLFHYSVILFLILNLKNYGQPIFMCELIILTVAISIIIMSILNRIPYVNQIIGAK